MRWSPDTHQYKGRLHCADEAGQELVARVRAMLVAPGMLKRLMCSKSPIPVRSACCALIALLCKR